MDYIPISMKELDRILSTMSTERVNAIIGRAQVYALLAIAQQLEKMNDRYKLDDEEYIKRMV